MSTRIEIHRTRKGRILLDTARDTSYGQLYEVWLRRSDGTEELVEEVGDPDVARALLQDLPMTR